MSLTTEPSKLSVRVDSAGWPLAECDVQIIAAATGPGNATWEGATFRWFWGVNRAAPTDSQTLTAEDVAEGFGTEISEIQAKLADWRVWAPFPFEIELSYRYRPAGAGSSQVATNRFACGPKPPATPPDLPVVMEAALAPSAGGREPGDTLVVQYEAISAQGLWATMIATVDAFERDSTIAEHMQTSVGRTVRMPIPVAVNIGVPGRLGVFAFDAFGQYGGTGLTFESLGDYTPPTVTVRMFAKSGALTETLAGTFFAGESLSFLLSATDNHQVTSVVWEASPGTYRDSVLFEAPVVGANVSFPVRAEWQGGMELRFFARDAAGLTSAIKSSAPGAFTVLPTINRPTWAAFVAGSIFDFVIDTARNVVYLAQSNEARIGVFSLATKTLAQTLAVHATGADLTPGGDSLIAAVPASRTLAVIDLRQAQLAATMVPLSGLDEAAKQSPTNVRVAKNGKAFVTLGGNAQSAYRLLEYDFTTAQQRMRTDGEGSGIAYGIERSHDHSTVVVIRNPCVQRYESASDAFGACGVLSPTYVAPSADRTGQRFGLGVKVYDANLAFLRQVESTNDFINASPMATIDANGEYLYHYIFPEGILRSRVSDGALLDRTPWPHFMPTAMRMSPDGSKLILVENHYSSRSRVGVLDLTPQAASVVTDRQPPLATPVARSRTMGPPPVPAAGASRAPSPYRQRD